MAIPTGSSIVGTWRVFVDWGVTGAPIFAGAITINANGSWTYSGGGGQWIQVEGMCYFNFSNPAGLVYTANVHRDALSGIMGYAVAGPDPGVGVWWATHPGAPTVAAGAEQAAAQPGHDYMTKPKK
ncbi:MAG TPA: hypothetical protein VGO01_11095 [Bradyrhizobium sp.]|jgi:hypothetical protein|nr:hypothetical protein [Bradyrhizobium sp.]